MSRSQPVNAHTTSQYGLLAPPPPLLVASNPSPPSLIYHFQPSADSLQPKVLPEQSNWTPNNYTFGPYYGPVELLDYPQTGNPFQYTHYSLMQPTQQINNSNQVWSTNQALPLPVPLPLPLPVSAPVSAPLPQQSASQQVIQGSSDEFENLTDYGTRKPFISKLGYLLRNPDLFSDVIQWNSPGTIFIVAPSLRFTEEVLPQIFSHSSFSAFTRQLNTYAFRHLTNSQLANTFSHSPDTTTPIKDLSAWQNDQFTRDRPEDANRMLPIPSRARAQNRMEKQKLLMERGTSLASRVRRPAAQPAALPVAVPVVAVPVAASAVAPSVTS